MQPDKNRSDLEKTRPRTDELTLRVLEARIQELVKANQALEREIKESSEAEREQRALAEALRDTAAALTSTLNLDEVLDRILLNVGKVVDHDAANVMLLETGILRVVRHRGYRYPDQASSIDGVRLRLEDVPNLAAMVKTRQPGLIDDVEKDPNWYDIPANKTIRSFAGAPIVLDGEVIGFVNLDSHKPDFFKKAHLQRLEAFAAQAALALRNARLYQSGQALAVLEERQRLARDLHDAVSQTLWSASLITDVLPELWEQDPDEARRSLDKLRRLNYSALSEMRTLLLELRPDGLASAELDDSLQRLTASVASWSGLEASFQSAGGGCCLPPNVRVAFYRIAQEALNNAVRHADAHRVDVRLEHNALGQFCRLTITDDGHGFETGLEQLNRLGLRIMRERAEKTGAQFNIQSEPGRGTWVSVAWSPLIVAQGDIGEIS